MPRQTTKKKCISSCKKACKKSCGALSKVISIAKAIRREDPGMEWKTALKKAGAEYRKS